MGKQEVFFPFTAPLAGALAGPLIDSVAAPLIKDVVKKQLVAEHHHLERDITTELYIIIKICLEK